MCRRRRMRRGSDGMKAMTAERCSGIKSGYWSAEKKEDLVQQLGLYEHQILSPAKIERFQKLRTRLKGAREIVELANECGRRVCDEVGHFACPFGDESMENCALRLEAKYDETIGLLLDLAETMG